MRPQDRGASILSARVTDWIMAGIVSIEDGAWFSPNADGDACNSSCVDVTPA